MNIRIFSWEHTLASLKPAWLTQIMEVWDNAQFFGMRKEEGSTVSNLSKWQNLSGEDGFARTSANVVIA